MSTGPFGPVIVTCDGVNVLSWIGSSNFTVKLDTF